MKKIASPTELRAEIQSIMAFVQGHGPDGKPDRQVVASKLRALADRVAGGAGFWVDQFKTLDRALPRFDSSKVTDWNKVMNHYRASGLKGRAAGIPAHWYSEYRSGNMTLDEAARGASKELPNAARVLGDPIVASKRDRVAGRSTTPVFIHTKYEKGGKTKTVKDAWPPSFGKPSNANLAKAVKQREKTRSDEKVLEAEVKTQSGKSLAKYKA